MGEKIFTRRMIKEWPISVIAVGHAISVTFITKEKFTKVRKCGYKRL